MAEPETKTVERDWDAGLPGQAVRLRDNPGRQGKTTGRTKQVGSYLMAEVDFGPNEKQFKRYDLLELVEPEEEMFELLAAGRFGGASDLRRVLTFEKVKGDLTNVFYSMESSNTDFYPHQFKPVLKFIESPVGRLLIADEVGLGKTIESVYIWKELQARQDARRLLVVCPAMLREKWRGDLKKCFNIIGDIISAKELLQKITEFERGGPNATFVYIVSLESLRPPSDFVDESKTSTRAKFARLLDQNTASDDFALFDLVILDEAHYLRNPSTANNRLGRLLREAARHMVLLTATPVQIHSDNLYQILRLIDPEEFHDAALFGDMLSANAPIVRALRALWRLPPDTASATDAINQALESLYFEGDSVLERIKDQVAAVAADPTKRIELVRLLEARSLLGQYMTRSRKREVLERRVERAAQVLTVHFSEEERAIYKRVTDRIRTQSAGKSGVSLFALIARQRQMASSLVAALESWTEKGILEELLWEDLGRSIQLDEIDGEGPANESDDTITNLSVGSDGDPGAPSFDVKALESGDGKYQALKTFLLTELGKNPSEKFVLFAFFRGTLTYLRRRLEKDGVKAALIMGGMGDEKDAVLEAFASPEGPSVLLSSEVGSEGIDLQFCRFVVNYDLPWNPMRVEQRIGRLDRLGQKSDRISIINFVVQDTIEDRILMRLYDRINVFRESIGDLEEILGESTEQLMMELLNPQLSDEERDRRAREAEMAILNQRAEQERLEEEAVNLLGFSDYILNHIKDSREKGRWLSGDELIAMVDDFFARKYPGTKLEEAGKEYAVKLRLSDEAKTSLGVFIAEVKPATRTRLHQSPSATLCVFDPRQSRDFGRDVEFVDPTHPLIQWIRADYTRDQRQLHQVSAVKLSADSAPVPAGDYAFVVHRWSFVGLRSDHVLSFMACPIRGDRVLSSSDSENLVGAASRQGQPLTNAVNVVGDLKGIAATALTCEEALGKTFDERMQNFDAENELRCNQQETSARKFAERRIAELKERLQRFHARNDIRPIPMTEGLLRKEEAQLKAKLARIEQRRRTDPTMIPIATGFVRVE